MTKTLADTPARDAYLALVQVHDRLTSEFEALFRRHGLTSAQFNVLRILVQGPRAGVTCSEIGAQLVHRVPDVTRLVDRLHERGWVARARCADDRRVVRVRLTPAGRRRCTSLYAPVDRLHRDQFAHLSPHAASQLDRLLRQLLEG